MQCFHIQLLVRTVLRRSYYDCRTVLRQFQKDETQIQGNDDWKGAVLVLASWDFGLQFLHLMLKWEKLLKGEDLVSVSQAFPASVRQQGATEPWHYAQFMCQRWKWGPGLGTAWERGMHAHTHTHTSSGQGQTTSRIWRTRYTQKWLVIKITTKVLWGQGVRLYRRTCCELIQFVLWAI